MQGLLGPMDDPQSAGLLSLGLRLMSTPGNFGSALGTAGLGAMGDMQQARQMQEQRKRQEQMMQMQQMQMEQAKRQQALAEEAQARQAAIEQAYRGAIRSPEQQAMGQFGGPTVAAAGAAPGMAPAVDQAALIRGLMQADPVSAYKMMQPKERKLSKLEQMRGPDGKMINVAIFEDGTTAVLPYGVRPDIALQNLGNRVTAIDKNDTLGGQSFAMGQTPESVASERSAASGRAVTMRGQDMTATAAAQRLVFDATQAAQPPQKLTATQEKAQAEQAKAGRQSEQMMSAMNEARSLLGSGPTESGMGAGGDWAGRQIGMSSSSARTAAQLETLSGWMVANVPRMEGPQSNFDIQNYQVMAAKVGDRTVPVSERTAALDTLEQLHRRYAEINGTPLPPKVEAKPGGKPARISSDADYKNLPPGALFIAPDGTTRRKP